LKNAIADFYGDIRAAGYLMRTARVWQVDKRTAAAVRLIASAVGLYLLGETRAAVRGAVSVATGYGLAVGPVLRRVS
jgi:hypothetical protein